MLPEKSDVNSVQGVSNGEGVSAAPVAETPAQPQGGVSQVETPAQPPVDVEALKARYEKDISQIKSTLQRREAQVEQQWQKRYGELQSQMHQIRMQGMTEEERSRYERQLETEEFQSLQSRLEQVETEKNSLLATYRAKDFFVSQGVPADKLNLDEGYDVIVSNGWEYLTQELSRLRQAQSSPTPQPKPVEPAPLKQAPPVVNDKGTPASGTTWAALRAQYGSDEAVYRAVEEGRLSSSVIPTN